MFDFDNDGELDHFEAAIGASIAGSIGYGAGLSDEEARFCHLRDEYEKELAEKQSRIDELEDELSRTRTLLELRDRHDEDSCENLVAGDKADDIDDDEEYKHLYKYFDEYGYFDYAEAYLDGAFKPFGDMDPSSIVVCLDKSKIPK